VGGAEHIGESKGEGDHARSGQRSDAQGKGRKRIWEKSFGRQRKKEMCRGEGRKETHTLERTQGEKGGEPCLKIPAEGRTLEKRKKVTSNLKKGVPSKKI